MKHVDRLGMGVDRFRFLSDDNNNWYLIPEDRAHEFGVAVNYFRSKPSLDAFYESFDKYKVRTSIQSYSFAEPTWEEY